MGAIMEENISVPRPSMYLATRLTRLVQEFRQRLQERVQVRKNSTELLRSSYQRGLRRRAFSNFERISRPRRHTVSLEDPQPDLRSQTVCVQSLLDDLDEHTHHRSSSLIKIATDDHLFLNHSSEQFVETLAHTISLPHAAYLFDLSSLLIERLDTLQNQCGQQPSHSLSEEAYKRLQDEKFIANLVHLLRRLQYMLFEILVHRSLWQITEIVLYWQEYRRQQNKLDDGWFAEWPSGERPLSTTFPWNIRPSLVVLWGVCWMFYPQNHNHKISAAGILDSPGFREAWMHNLDSTSPEDLFNINSLVMEHENETYEQADDNATAPMGQQTQAQAREGAEAAGLGGEQGYGAAPQATFPGVRGPAPAPAPPLASSPNSSRNHFAQGPPFEFYSYAHPSQTDLYSTRPPVPSSTFASVGPWPETSGGNFQHPTYASYQDNPNVLQTAAYSHLSHTPFLQPARSVAPQLTIQPPDAHHPQTSFESFSPHSRTALQEYHPYNQPPPFGLGMGEGPPQYPPSPARSDGTGRRHSVAVSSADSLTPTTPTKMPNDHITSPSSAGSAARREKLSVKRDRDPPRNLKNQIYCDHEECAENPPTFRRPCEWNKHMDKHDRPYKCLEPGCDKIQGFTYSGGLLRHQREVHKKNTTTKKPLMCPHPDCNRSSGHGFSRLENLKEHLRRRHMPTEGQAPDELAEQVKQEADAGALSRKRKRPSDRAETSGYDESEDSDDLREQIKRLKEEAVEKDRRLGELEASVKALLNGQRR